MDYPVLELRTNILAGEQLQIQLDDNVWVDSEMDIVNDLSNLIFVHENIHNYRTVSKLSKEEHKFYAFGSNKNMG